MRFPARVVTIAMTAALGACAGTGDTKTSSARKPADTAASIAPAKASSASPAPPATAVASPSPAPRKADTLAKAPPRAAGPRRVVIGGVDFTGIGHDQGSVNAPVVVIDFSDFGCPYCAEFTRETYPVIEREYVKTGKVFFKYVPFIVGMFPHAAEATRAVECVAEQGRFWTMADHVYEAQSAWKRSRDPRELLMGIADVVGADTVVASRCYDDRRTDRLTARATGVANDVGVRVTPSFLVNDRPVQGALPLADFRKVIDAALLLSKAGP